MSNSGDLLRMLEPAVRPVATPASGAASSASNTPATFESQTFEQLLGVAQQTQDAMNPAVEANESSAPDPLAALSRIDSVSNASLRSMLTNQA